MVSARQDRLDLQALQALLAQQGLPDFPVLLARQDLLALLAQPGRLALPDFPALLAQQGQLDLPARKGRRVRMESKE